MTNRSNAVRRMGKTRCYLCNRNGTIKNPLSRHHCDGNPKNNAPENHIAVHRILCHSFADYITQFHMFHRKKATAAIIRRAWTTFRWDD